MNPSTCATTSRARSEFVAGTTCGFTTPEVYEKEIWLTSPMVGSYVVWVTRLPPHGPTRRTHDVPSPGSRVVSAPPPCRCVVVARTLRFEPPRRATGRRVLAEPVA